VGNIFAKLASVAEQLLLFLKTNDILPSSNIQLFDDVIEVYRLFTGT